MPNANTSFELLPQVKSIHLCADTEGQSRLWFTHEPDDCNDECLGGAFARNLLVHRAGEILSETPLPAATQPGGVGIVLSPHIVTIFGLRLPAVEIASLESATGGGFISMPKPTNTFIINRTNAAVTCEGCERVFALT